MSGANLNAGRDVNLSVGGDLVAGDQNIQGEVVHVSNQIYQTITKEVLIPRMAPPPPASFVGQSELLFELVVYLQETAANVTDTVPLLFLSGMGGVGKTAVAEMLANDPDIDEMYPDGTLWAELGPEPDLMLWLATWGDQLGTDLSGYSTLDARARALSTLVHGKKLLVVLDNVWQAPHIRPLLVMGAESHVVVTTRDTQLVTVLSGRNTTHFRIEPLDEDTGLELLGTIAPQAVEQDEATARELVRYLGGLPLSITLAGQTVASEFQAGFGVSTALAELMSSGRGEVDSADGQSLWAMLAVSYDHLPDAEAQRAFRSLAVFGARPRMFEVKAAAYVWQMEERAAQKLVVTLVNQQMIEAQGEGLFSLHNAFADFARQLLIEKRELTDLQVMHAEYFMLLAQEYGESDWKRIEKNIDQIRYAFQIICNEGDHRPVLQMLSAMNGYFARRGLWQEQQQWTEIGLTMVKRVGDKRLEGILHSNLGAIYHRQNALDRALSAYKESSSILHKSDDREGLAVVLNNMGAIYARLELIDEAFEAYEQGQEILEQSMNRDGQASLATTLNNIGTLHQRREEWQAALAYHDLSYKFYEALQDPIGLANTLNYIGTIYERQGRTADALLQFDRSRYLFVEAGDIVGEANALYNMALIYEEQSQIEQAESCMTRVVEIEEILNHPALMEDQEMLQRLRQQLKQADWLE